MDIVRVGFEARQGKIASDHALHAKFVRTLELLRDIIEEFTSMKMLLGVDSMTKVRE